VDIILSRNNLLRPFIQYVLCSIERQSVDIAMDSGYRRHLDVRRRGRYTLLAESVVNWVTLEIDRDVLGGQSLVDALDEVDFVLEEFLIVGVKGDFDETGAVDSDSGALGNDGAGGEEILEEVLVDGGEGSGAWSHL